jgi:hypothetical protein
MKSRQEYIQSLHNEIDEWNKQIDRLTARAGMAEADYRLELETKIDSLKQQRAAIEAEVENLSTTSEESWKDLKEGLDSAWDKMSEAVSKAVASLSK